MKYLLIVVALCIFAGFGLLANQHIKSETVNISAIVLGCGDEVVQSAEQCDGVNLNNQSCSSLGNYSGGALSCSSICMYNFSSCIPRSVGTGSDSGSGGSSGGSSGFSNNTVLTNNIVFSGRAYPLSKVGILKDGQLVATTIAGPDATFSVTVGDLTNGNYTFSVYGEDKQGIRSSLFSFPIYISQSITTKIEGIFIPPTIGIDKEQVKKGDNITVFGQTSPLSDVTISVHSPVENFISTKSDAQGIYVKSYDTTGLEIGSHQVKAKSAVLDVITPFGNALQFTVGTENIFAELPKKTVHKSDVNGDGKVNLVDFSILAYWYKRPNPPAGVDINQDGKADLIDMSIMAYNWTG